jgi:4'-phosphopantetheinyl transferase
MHGLPSRSPGQTLREREVHVWHVALDGDFPPAESRAACLSAAERARSTLFVAPLERQRFVMSRIVLRDILAAYSGAAAGEIPIAREPGGRPFIEGTERLYFSLSHSGATALIAVAEMTIGVDVERVRRISRADAVARRVLHADTVAALESLSVSEREVAFVDAWTQREAHVKAVGGGMFRTPDELPFDPMQPDDASVHPTTSRSDGTVWSVARFVPCEGARAAVVTPGLLRSIRIMDWDDVARGAAKERG